MTDKPVKIKVYSNYKDVSVIENAVRHLEYRNIKAATSYPKSFEIRNNDIVILQIKDIESTLLKKISDRKNELKNKTNYSNPSNYSNLLCWEFRKILHSKNSINSYL